MTIFLILLTIIIIVIVAILHLLKKNNKRFNTMKYNAYPIYNIFKLELSFKPR